MPKVLGLTLGDRYGIGPELVARVIDKLPVVPDLRIAVIGDREVFAAARRGAGLAEDCPRADGLAAVRRGSAPWALIDRPAELPVDAMGRMSPQSGAEMLDTLGWLVQQVEAGQLDGIVYAPLNKQAMKAAGHAAGDELDFLAQRLPVADICGEINVLNGVWTSRVTSHVPLGMVAGRITRDSVGRGIRLLDRVLRQSGKASPRLAVAALNPHAGEGGAYGREEIDIIAPAIAAAREAGIVAEGPFPSDTVFPRAFGGGFDGVVTMFHDQGQIALKLVGLGQGITLLAGFPVPIATPGHGTAYDIVGTGKARTGGLEAALALVTRMMGIDTESGRDAADH
jgi:4-hydroxythreonine-4-phosphate dehydrogenase